MILGVGINDADYKIREVEYNGWTNGKQNVKFLWVCPYFDRWQSMLTRGYSDKFKSKNPTYSDVTVCDEWLTFSTFKQWMETQKWEGRQLDKDLLVKGNKQYHPERCLFVTPELNKFMNTHSNRVKTHKTGVRLRANGRYMAVCNQLDGKEKSVGTYNTEDEAHNAWLVEKIRLANILAERENDPIISNAILNYYS